VNVPGLLLFCAGIGLGLACYVAVYVLDWLQRRSDHLEQRADPPSKGWAEP
jgi:hypothetical protein